MVQAPEADSLRSNVNLVRGFFGSDWATLVVERDRVSLVRGSETLFDVPRAQLGNVRKLGWLPFRRGHLQLTAGGRTYTLAFPAMSGFAGRTSGRKQAEEWAAYLRGGNQRSEAGSQG